MSDSVKQKRLYRCPLFLSGVFHFIFRALTKVKFYNDGGVLLSMPAINVNLWKGLTGSRCTEDMLSQILSGKTEDVGKIYIGFKLVTNFVRNLLLIAYHLFLFIALVARNLSNTASGEYLFFSPKSGSFFAYDYIKVWEFQILIFMHGLKLTNLFGPEICKVFFLPEKQMGKNTLCTRKI